MACNVTGVLQETISLATIKQLETQLHWRYYGHRIVVLNHTKQPWTAHVLILIITLIQRKRMRFKDNINTSPALPSH